MTFSKVLIYSFLALTTFLSLHANASKNSSLNIACTLLKTELPGETLFSTELIGLNLSNSTQFKIKAISEIHYVGSSKDGNIDFTLSNKDSGEAGTCVISFKDGDSLTLTDMDLDQKQFIFLNDDSTTKLTISKVN